MSYAICRIKKIKTLGAAKAAGDHVHRLVDTPNANPSKPITRLHGSGDLQKDVEARLPKKRRSNAVLAVEMMLSASPEWFRGGGSLEDWTDRCLAWLEAKFGNNCVSVVLHADETTEHLHAHIIPIDSRGKLNCDGLFGTPQKLSQLQDDYAEAMQPLGLQRGIKKALTKRRHQSVRKFYSMCNEVESKLDVGKAVAVLHQAIQKPPRSAGHRPAM